MKFPLTPFGRPQVIVYPLGVAILMALLGCIGWRSLSTAGMLLAQAPFALILIWALSFFRDPHRVIPENTGLLVSPADGRVTDVETLDGFEDHAAPVLRIGIFLSIFNVHINRAPCRARVIQVTHKPGQYRNALSPESSRVNESNTVTFLQLDAPQDPIWVRQISGAIARRIVCQLKPETTVDRGVRFGMIKFGSRTELYVPVHANLECQVQPGDTVKAGSTVLARYLP
jgi:phosphatidylserine decarboxylase